MGWFVYGKPPRFFIMRKRQQIMSRRKFLRLLPSFPVLGLAAKQAIAQTQASPQVQQLEMQVVQVSPKTVNILSSDEAGQIYKMAVELPEHIFR